MEVDTHAHIATGHDEAKFGIAAAELPAAFALSTGSPHLTLVGLASHVGSQLTETTAYLDAATTLLRLAEDHQQALGALQFLDFGGGFGIDYGDGCAARPADFVRAPLALVQREPFAQRRCWSSRGAPGGRPRRAGRVGADPVQALRTEPARRWLMIDAGMNDLCAPRCTARVTASSRWTATRRGGARVTAWWVPCARAPTTSACTRSPSLGPRRVVIRDAGAYGFTMASQYNGRALPAEVFVAGGVVRHVARSPGVDAWVQRRLGA